MNREPKEPKEQEELPAEPQKTCSDAELEQVSGGQKTRQKGASPGISPGTSIDV